MYNELSLQQRIYLLRAGVLKEVTYTTTHIGVLFEEFLIESKSKTENDDMGKLHELRLAYHLSSDNDMDKHLPEHHRATNSEDPAHNGDPKTVHDRIAKRLGTEKSNIVDTAARQSAEAWKKQYLKKGEKVGRVFWTSNRDQIHRKTGEKIPGDHYKTTGIHDPNSNADLILQITDKNGKHLRWHGISAKFGKNEPNLNNPGLDSLEKISGKEKGHFNSLMKSHDDLMQKLGYSGKSRDDRHEQWKIEQMATSSDEDKGIEGVRKQHDEYQKRLESGEKLKAKEKKFHEHSSTFLKAYDGLKDDKSRKEFMDSVEHRTKMAVSSGQEARRKISAEITEGLSKKIRKSADGTYDDSELRDTVNKLVSPQTAIEHSVVHSRLHDDGKTTHPEISDQSTYASKHLNRFKNLRVAGGDGQSTYIKGILNEPGNPKNGKEMNVAQMTTKASSGPMTNTVGTFKLTNKKTE